MGGVRGQVQNCVWLLVRFLRRSNGADWSDPPPLYPRVGPDAPHGRAVHDWLNVPQRCVNVPYREVEPIWHLVQNFNVPRGRRTSNEAGKGGHSRCLPSEGVDFTEELLGIANTYDGRVAHIHIHFNMPSSNLESISITPVMSLAKTPKEVKRVKAELEAIPEKDRKGCVLQELTMFECDRELAEKAGIIKCYPVPRIFRVYVYINVFSHFLGPTQPQVSWTTRSRSYLAFKVRRGYWKGLIT